MLLGGNKTQHNKADVRDVETELYSPLTNITVHADETDETDGLPCDPCASPTKVSWREISVPIQKDASRESHTVSEDFKALWHLLACPVNVLMVFVPLALFSRWTDWSEELKFGLNFLAILPLAGLLGAATEELSGSVGEVVGGLLNATFGNAVEMILAVFALREGLVDVVQGSLLGSILSNLLLVLGMCFLFGGLKFHSQAFNANGAKVQASLLLLSVLAMVMPSLAVAKTDKADMSLEISRGASIILAILYGLYLLFQLRTHPEQFQLGEEAEHEEVMMSSRFAALIMLIVTGLVSVCSETLVGAIEGLTNSMGISRSFIGVILLPIVGNAAEHATAVTVAMKNNMDLALGVTLGSSAQIALFVVPFSVLAGWAMDVPMDLNFQPVSTGILMLTVLIVGNLTSDGGSNWLEGAMLLAAYLLISVTFWFY